MFGVPAKKSFKGIVSKRKKNVLTSWWGAPGGNSLEPCMEQEENTPKAKR